MPHYADGTEAKVGDQVIAPVFNSGRAPKAGVIVSITPGQEACNAMIQFSEVVDIDAPRPRMAIGRAEVVRTEQHCNGGPQKAVYACADYCDTNKLTKVG